MLLTELQFFASFVVAVAATMIVVPPLRKVAIQRRWLDLPDGNRKVHSRPVPSVGGVAIVTGTIVGLIYLISISPLLPFEIALPPGLVWIGAIVMVCTGIYDDLRGLGFREKFLLQIMVAYMLMFAGYRLDVSGLWFLESADPFTEALISVPLTLLWIVGLINAVNLLDGLDGLAAGLGVIALASLAFIHGMRGDIGAMLFALPLMGALVGFLVYNFNPASIFMGDSGSLFLGYMIAAYSLSAPTHSDPAMSLVILLVVLGLPVVDTCNAMLRRYLRGVGLFSPDRDHVHHRLTRRFPHRLAVLILYSVGMGLGVAGVFMAVADARVAYVGLLVVGVLTIAGLRYLGYSPRDVGDTAGPKEGRKESFAEGPPREVKNGRTEPADQPAAFA